MRSAWIVCCAVAAAIGDRPHRWRHIDPEREAPATLLDAKLLHLDGREAMFKAGRSAGAPRRQASAPRTPPTWHSSRQQRSALLATLAVVPDGSSGGSSGPTVSPLDFGADPTGATDSTAAMNAAMAALLNHTAGGVPPMADAIVNLGGATLDLRGGEYLISAPLVIPKLIGNVRVRGGSLRANAAAFPADRFLIEVGEEGCNAKVKQGVCNEMISFDNLFLDAGHRAAGGIVVANTMGTTIGPSAFFTGFVQAGVRVLQGHETVISDSWFAEFYWSDPAGAHGNSSSVGVDLHGQDNYLTNVIVFDFTHLGVSVDGAATLLEGVHTWNGGGVGILINGSYAIQDRLLACYLDYNTLTIVDPTQTTVEDTFFLDTQAVLVQSKKPAMQSVVFRENVYAYGQAAKWGVNQSIVLDGSWATCGAVTVEDELPAKGCCTCDGWACGIKQTAASETKYVSGAANVTFDFSRQLLLPHIDHVQFAVLGERAGEVSWHTLEPVGTSVTVVFSAAATVRVDMDVKQCL